MIASAGLLAGGVMSAAGSSANAASSGRAAIASTRATVPTGARAEGAVAPSARVPFIVTLGYRHPEAAAAAVQAVTDPTSARYHRYYTAKGWEARFSPTVATVAKVSSWLRHEGLTVGAVTPDRLNIDVTGSAASIERAFDVSLDNYKIAGRTTRVATTDATVPAALSGVVAGVAGLSEVRESSTATTGATAFTKTFTKAAPTTSSATTDEVPAPAGFRNPPDCAKFYGQKLATSDPAYGPGYASPLPLAVCGYTPEQLESAYGLTADYADGITGKGVTVAIVDAYVAKTLLADGQEFYAKNDPAEPLATTQFTELLPQSFNDQTACGAEGWAGEQTLDVEAVHGTAPGANILYTGAENCTDTGLFGAVEKVVDRGLADIVTNSWGDTGGDLLTPSSDRKMFDNVLMMAAATGIGVQFSAGDDGDNFHVTGLVTPDYPASSPYVTAVGGTSLAVGYTGAKLFEAGWSTSKSYFCTATAAAVGICTTAQIGTYTPGAPGAYDYGGGGGTSYNYAEPYYQDGVVPSTLADRNLAVTGVANRVEPDISMDADPTTGMLVGETQQFPNGTYYDQYRIGGTSVASPLLAGVLALVDQAAGTPLGFANPAIYKSYTDGGSHIYDVKNPSSKLALARVDYVDGVNGEYGTYTSIRGLNFEGVETYCDGTGSCGSRPVALKTTKGFDSMTGLGSPDPGFVTALSRF